MWNKKKNIIAWSIIFMSVFGIFFGVYAINRFDQWWRVSAHSSTGVSRHDQWTCRKIINSWSKDIFVPTKSDPEWESFVAHTPTNVQITAWTGICGTMNNYTCTVGQPANMGCDYDDATRTCEDVCNIMDNVPTSCVISYGCY